MITEHKELKEVTKEIEHCDKCNINITEEKANENLPIYDSYISYWEKEDDGQHSWIKIDLSIHLCKKCAKELFTKVLPELGYRVNDEYERNL